MNNLFDTLKQNKVFKITIVLIVVFFSFLIYFNKPKAATCQCNNWVECTWDEDEYGNQTNKQCKCFEQQYIDCMEGGGDPPLCDSGEYVCNAPSGCCTIASPTPTGTPSPSCDPNDWSPCTETCGTGETTNDCNTTQACNEHACPTSCNDSCTAIAECTSINPAWTCYAASNTCRLAVRPASLTCTPCTPSCGGAECGNLAAAPNQVTGIQVNGEDLGNLDLTLSSSLTITWDDPGTSDPFGAGVITYYTVQVWNKTLGGNGTTPPYPCDATSYCNENDTAGKVESLTVPAISDHDNDIYVAVRAINDVCVSVGYGPPSSSSSYNLVANVSGNFYEDPSAVIVGLNDCSGSSTTPVDLSSYVGTTITTDIGGTAGGIGTSFAITDVPYAPTASWGDHGFDINLSIDNSSDPANSLTCTCPAGPCNHTDTASPSLNEHIYLININLSNGPWWQTSGGNIYGASSLVSTIPDTCSDSVLCDAYTITENLVYGDANSSAGVPITGASVISSGDGSYTQRGALEPRALDSDHNNLIRENYSYFSREVNLATADTISGTITSLPSGATPDTDSTEVYYSNGDLTVDITSTEDVTSSRKVVIFVNGDLILTSNSDTEMINVDEGSFLAFIASGDITFEANLGNSSALDTSPNIAGVFIADGTININGYSEAPTSDDALIDNKFVGEGTFVGWSGFNPNRDYDNTTNPLQKELNNENPIEVFVFRPDFNLNIPSIMKRPSLVWQEVN